MFGTWSFSGAWSLELGGFSNVKPRRQLIILDVPLHRAGREHRAHRGREPLAPEPATAEPQVTEPQVTGPEVAEPAAAAGTEVPDPAAGPRPVTVSSWSAGALLLRASLAGAGAGTVRAAAGGEPQDVALLTAVSMCFALGAATTEQLKHPAAAGHGAAAGLGALPGLRALRPELARIADGTDPLR